MNPSVMRSLLCCALSIASLASLAQTPTLGPAMLIVRTSAKDRTEVVGAIKAYSEQKKWLYVGDSKIKNGEVTLVKFCIPQVSQALWPLGLQISAMMPCGNVGVYEKQGKTEISMLHPVFIQVLYPGPEAEAAVKVATPLLLDMLESVAK
jgi:hypothetical protein